MMYPERWIFAGLAAILIGLGFMMYDAIQDEHAFKAACKERGGFPVMTRDIRFCFKEAPLMLD